MTTTLFPCLSYADPEAGMDFLRAVGFTEAAVYRNAEDPRMVEHAQFGWGERGGVMFGSVREENGSNPAGDTYRCRPGMASCYCVVGSDDEVDAVYQRALAAGATGVRPPQSPPYGGRECLVRDGEGNQWSFGSYPGEQG